MKDFSAFNRDDLEINGMFNENIYKKLESDKEMTNALIKISQLLIAEEFSNNLKDVSPTYNVIKMKPSWKLPNLIDALYFSIYYKNSKDSVLKKCRNERCGEYFEVSKTNSRKIYCSDSCREAKNQRNYQKGKNKGS